MNNPSPLIPQGSMLEQKNKSRARVKVTFFCIVGAHVAAIVIALLAQGCKREQPPVQENTQPSVPITDTNLPPLDTNAPLPGVTDTNVPALPPIDTAPPPQPPANPPGGPVAGAEQEYAIQKGDSYYTIGKKFNVSTKALQDANPGVDPSKLQIGKKIKIPAPTAPSSTAAPSGAAPVSSSGEPIYVVKSGDTLSKIATDHHTTVNAIRKANNLTTDRIKVGDKLKMPVSAPPPAAPAPGAPPQ